MLDERKAAILRVVVEEYIETAQPVGSSHVAAVPSLSVSSATVRNEMATLERDGYLVQPHTSAGRIPTDKGYRFFVDSLTEPGPLDPARRQQVKTFFARAHGELEQMLQDTSRLLSGLTDYAAVVVGPSREVATVREVLAILEQQYVVVTMLRDVLDRGLSVAIGAEHGVEPLAECSIVVAPYGGEGEPAGTIGVLGPTRMNYPQALAAVAVVSKRLGTRLAEG